MRSFRRARAALARVALAALLGGAGTLAWSAGALGDLPPGGLQPTPLAEAGTVRWLAVGVETSYKVAVSTAPRGDGSRTTTYFTIARSPGEVQTFRPALSPGQSVYVGVSADGGELWSQGEAVVTGAGAEAPAESIDGEAGAGQAAPPGEGEGEEAEVPAQERLEAEAGVPRRLAGLATATAPPIIGTNDGAGWGALAASKILAGHITWDRVDIDAWSQAISTSASYGFKILAIAAPVNDATPLSQVEPKAWGGKVAAELASHGGISLAEAGNESYLKGGVANPAQYGRMYLAAIAAMKERGLTERLLFNMTGDYPYGTWASPTGWSTDASGRGWLHDAVAANPGLKAAILANGISIHPYGAVGVNRHDDWGIASAAADEAVAARVLGATPPMYVTEVGYDLSRCGTEVGACSGKDQATKLKAAYAELEADPHVAGIWWYQSHDDSTGRFGFMNRSGTVRASYAALKGVAIAAGQ